MCYSNESKMMTPSSTAKLTDKNKNTLPALLTDEEDSVCTITVGDSPIILIAPHSGTKVPKALYDKDNNPLGLPPSYFKERHEACDIGVQELINYLRDNPAFPAFNILSANYSRLVCDLNRIKEDSIHIASSEHEDQTVPGNTGLSDTECKQRYSEIFDVYRAKLKQLIKQTRAKHGYAMVIDLHSFTPEWKGENRGVQIGTVAYNTNPIEQTSVNSISETCKTAGFKFARNAPYDHTKMPIDRAEPALFIEECGASYIGIEHSNDLLQDSSALPKIANIITRCAEHLTLFGEQIIAHHQKSAYCSIKAPSTECFWIDTKNSDLKNIHTP